MATYQEVTGQPITTITVGMHGHVVDDYRTLGYYMGVKKGDGTIKGHILTNTPFISCSADWILFLLEEPDSEGWGREIKYHVNSNSDNVNSPSRTANIYLSLGLNKTTSYIKIILEGGQDIGGGTTTKYIYYFMKAIETGSASDSIIMVQGNTSSITGNSYLMYVYPLPSSTSVKNMLFCYQSSNRPCPISSISSTTWSTLTHESGTEFDATFVPLTTNSKNISGCTIIACYTIYDNTTLSMTTAGYGDTISVFDALSKTRICYFTISTASTTNLCGCYSYSE